MGDLVKGVVGGFGNAIKGIGGSIPGIKDLMGSEMSQDQFNAALAQQGGNREWSEYMSNTAHRREMADLQAAGLNPMLTLMKGGGASTPSAPGVPGGSVSMPGKSLGQEAATSQQISNAQAAETLTKAETAKVEAEAAEIRARTPTHAVNIERMRQEIDESVNRIGLIRQQTETSHATAANVHQQTINLRESIAQIKATVQHLGSMMTLNYQQVSALATTMGKTHAETEEIIQRVRAQLPQAQKAILELEVIFKRYAETGHRLTQEAQRSFLGDLDRAIRALRGSLQSESK